MLFAVAGFALLVGGAASAVPPTGVTVENEDIAMPKVSWSVPADAREIVLELRRGSTLVVSVGLEPSRTSWTAPSRLGHGAYQARVGSRPCTDDDEEPCSPPDFSPPTEFVIPPPSIEPGQGIAYVRRGMTQAQVQALWGRPSRSHGGDDPLRGTKYWTFDYNRWKLSVDFRGRPLRVNGVGTNNTVHRVKRVGVGSTDRQVRAAFPALRCKTFSERQSGRTFSWRYCWLGRLARGSVVTVFAMQPRARNRVGAVSVFRVAKLMANGSPL